MAATDTTGGADGASALGAVLVHASRPGREELSAALVHATAEVEFDRAQIERRSFGVLVVQVDDLELVRRAYGAELAERVHAEATRLVESAAGLEAMLGYRLDDRLVACVPDLDPARTEAIAAGLLAAARGLGIEVAGRAVRLRLSLGVAYNRPDGKTDRDELLLRTLVIVACESVEVAAAGGGEQVAHTELYDLVQRGFERREPERVEAQRAKVRAGRERAQAEAARRSAQAATGAASGAESAAPGESADPPASAPAGTMPVEGPAGGPAVGSGAPAAPRTSLSGTPFTRPAELADPAPAVANGAAGAGVAPGAVPAAPGVLPEGAAARPAAEEAGGPLAQMIRAVLTAQAGGTIDPRVADSIAALVDAWMAEERRRAEREAAERQASTSDVSLLERRISKLNEALERTEEELLRVSRLKVIDPGVPSAYRSVQGLSFRDDHYETKRALMADLFRANLELRRRLRAV